MGLTLLKLQKAQWVEFYAFADKKVRIEYRAYATRDAPGITTHHYKKAGRPVNITYWVFGQRAANPAEALRLYNKRQRKVRSDPAEAAGS